MHLVLIQRNHLFMQLQNVSAVSYHVGRLKIFFLKKDWMNFKYCKIIPTQIKFFLNYYSNLIDSIFEKLKINLFKKNWDPSIKFNLGKKKKSRTVTLKLFCKLPGISK